jgi:hypothetical protein
MNFLQKLFQQVDKNKVIDAGLILLITFMVVLFKMNRDHLL